MSGKDFHGGGDKRKTYAAWEKYDVDAALGETEKAERREDRVTATAKGHSRVAKVETTAAQEAVVGAGVLESRASVEALKAKLKRGGGGGGGGGRGGRGGADEGAVPHVVAQPEGAAPAVAVDDDDR